MEASTEKEKTETWLWLTSQRLQILKRKKQKLEILHGGRAVGISISTFELVVVAARATTVPTVKLRGGQVELKF